MSVSASPARRAPSAARRWRWARERRLGLRIRRRGAARRGCRTTRLERRRPSTVRRPGQDPRSGSLQEEETAEGRRVRGEVGGVMARNRGGHFRDTPNRHPAYQAALLDADVRSQSHGRRSGRRARRDALRMLVGRADGSSAYARRRLRAVGLRRLRRPVRLSPAAPAGGPMRQRDGVRVSGRTYVPPGVGDGGQAALR